jgi:hypothetical protein
VALFFCSFLFINSLLSGLGQQLPEFFDVTERK